jgi:hypothetical protein
VSFAWKSDYGSMARLLLAAFSCGVKRKKNTEKLIMNAAMNKNVFPHLVWRRRDQLLRIFYAV